MKRRGDGPRPYIVPTRLGSSYLIGLLALVMIAATYTNNLVYLLAFLMFSIALITMVQTHINVKDLEVADITVENDFVGFSARVHATLKNKARQGVNNLDVELMLSDRKTASLIGFIPARSYSRTSLSLPLVKRGVQKISGLRVSTTYPLGLFRAWVRLSANAEIFTYPVRKGTLPFPATGGGEGVDTGSLAKKGEDFSGHKKFETGSPPRHIDWKALARGRGLLLKEFHTGQDPEIVLDATALKELPLEARLSQLSQWISDAEREQRLYTLVLPSRTVAATIGKTHFHNCLKELARYAETAAA